jgi:hypothetical protein
MSESFYIVYPDGTDENGEPPIMLAYRAPGQVATQPETSGAVVRRGAVSGNPNYDPITGKFAGRRLRQLRQFQVVQSTIQQGALPQYSGTPTGIDPLVWAKRMAFVRDAARTLDEVNAENLFTYLEGKAVDVSKIDINQFMADVQWQRIADLADVLNASISKRLPIKMVAQRQWVKRIFLNLTPPQGLHLVKTLEGMGWSPDDIKKKVVKNVRNRELRAQLDQLYGEEQPPQGKEE